MDSHSQLRIGIIGFGHRSYLANTIHQPQAGVCVTHVCDIHPNKIHEVKKRFGTDARFSTSVDDLLADTQLDAVMILSPDWLHATHAIAAMHAGKAVFLEKPMATTIDDCDRILQTAAQTKSKLYVGHNMRHMGFVKKMKSLVDSGKIGQIQTAWERHFINYGGDAYFRDWHADRRYSTGLLLQKAAHDLDVMHWICGGYTRRVHAMGRLSVYNRSSARTIKPPDFDPIWSEAHWPPESLQDLNPVIDVEDLSMLHAELDNGILIAYQQCHYTPDEWRNYTFIGDAGRIESVKDDQGQWTIRLWNKRHKQSLADGDEQHRVESVAGGHDGADPAMIQEFIRYLRDQATPSCPPLAARMCVAAGYQATQSLRNRGVPMDVPPA